MHIPSYVVKYTAKAGAENPMVTGKPAYNFGTSGFPMRRFRERGTELEDGQVWTRTRIVSTQIKVLKVSR